MKGGVYLRNLEDMRIVMTLENILYDILIIVSRKHFADTAELDTIPVRGLDIARDCGELK
jgi:hypothetical protein